VPPLTEKSQSDLYGGVSVLENEYISLWYHPQHAIVHHQLQKIPTSEAFREMLLKGAELVEKRGAKKWLSDDRQNTVVREPDAQWGETIWAPRVIKAGFSHWAIVLPTAAIGKLNMQRFAAEYRRRGVTVNVSDNPETAFAWLKAQ
jgi:hypothetical protein